MINIKVCLDFVKINFVNYVSVEEASMFEEPSRGGEEFRNIPVLGNIGDRILLTGLAMANGKRGNKVQVKYHRCFYNPVSCFK